MQLSSISKSQKKSTKQKNCICHLKKGPNGLRHLVIEIKDVQRDQFTHDYHYD